MEIIINRSERKLPSRSMKAHDLIGGQMTIKRLPWMRREMIINSHEEGNDHAQYNDDHSLCTFWGGINRFCACLWYKIKALNHSAKVFTVYVEHVRHQWTHKRLSPAAGDSTSAAGGAIWPVRSSATNGTDRNSNTEPQTHKKTNPNSARQWLLGCQVECSGLYQLISIDGFSMK